ncbi:hypothetical protein QLX52_17560 [Streptomyces albus]|nr:hypothetical protein [Streptomyces albus]MDI6410639.1 hypothetical protein [Streptomyces albus]
MPPGTGLRAMLERACAQAGFRPRVTSRQPPRRCSPSWPHGDWESPWCPPCHRTPPPGSGCASCRRTRAAGPYRLHLAYRRTGGSAAPALLTRLRTALAAPADADIPAMAADEWVPPTAP